MGVQVVTIHHMTMRTQTTNREACWIGELAVSSSQVFRMGDWFKMFRVHAVGDSAQMVKFQPWIANEHGVNKAMGTPEFPRPSHSTVTMTLGGGPQPTTRISILGDFPTDPIWKRVQSLHASLVYYANNPVVDV